MRVIDRILSVVLIAVVLALTLVVPAMRWFNK